jgi:UDP-N-acetylmuramoyl-L-alanyl-D-glutamate--2,6-diaminopimelate ligase
VSSHALDQTRVDDCEYDYGIFTNLSQDHLDYHHTIEKYYVAKKRYFREILKDGEKMIINGDDPWGRQMIRETGISATTFGIHRECSVSSGHFDLSLAGIHADIATSNGNFSVSSSLIGKFNLYNILASVAVAVKLGIPPEVIKQGIEKLHNVPGRFQKVSQDEEPAVFVDYAHTDDALRNVLENLVQFKTHNIITVFGCGGDRDRGKRPLMGKAASDLSDLAIITSDNPRTEDPLEIINQIEVGVRETSARKISLQGIDRGKYDKGYTIIPDRREAIFTAVSIAGPRDILLIAGKGHENYQILGEKRIFFDDTIVAREALDKRCAEIVK